MRIALLVCGPAIVLGLAAGRARLMSTRRVRLLVAAYATDRATGGSLAATMASWHSLLSRPGWCGLAARRRSLALEVHTGVRCDGSTVAWLGICCDEDQVEYVEAALRGTYPNAGLTPVTASLRDIGSVVRLRRRCLARSEPPPVEFDPDRPPVEQLLRAMTATRATAVVQLALRPAPAFLKWGSRSPAAGPDGERESRPWARRSFVASIRVAAGTPDACRSVASAVVGIDASGHLARWPAIQPLNWRRVGLRARLDRGEFDSGFMRLFGGACSVDEVGQLWQLPSPAFAAVPVIRRSVPVAPASAGVLRVNDGSELLRDDHGPVTIHVPLRRQNVAIVGTVDQGKTSAMLAGVRADLLRPNCAVVVLDPKGDAAEAALSVVPADRVCTYLDFASPACGFNPLAVDAPVDAVADNVVAALRQLFTEGEIRGSSDRYLRNAVMAVLACDRRGTLWDVARLLSSGDQGTGARARVGHRLAELPDHAELASFMVDELPAQLSHARATTTAKLDAPANKLARILNSTSIRRVLLNDTHRVDFDQLIADRGVLVVRGALGQIGAGNVSVLMQLLLGMLDASLSRRQDRGAGLSTAIALKVDEAPLVINEAFAQTLALKRSAGLETMACWQTDSQWPPELRDQLDALFAHRILFATASADDARRSSALLMAEYSDQLRAGDGSVSALASPEVRLHLPRHTAIASWTTPVGRERPFIARTVPLAVDRERIAWHLGRQLAAGGRVLGDDARPPELPTLAAVPLSASPAPDASQLPVDAAQSRSVAPQLPQPEASDRAATPPPGLASEVPQSLAELDALEFDGRRIRWLPVAPARPTRVGPVELEILDWIAGARCALTTQVHRRFNPGRSLTTTQRRLKLLADGGLIARFQAHHRDGGGAPMGCVATQAGLEAVGARNRRPTPLEDETLPGLLDDVRTVGWIMALERASGGAVRSVLGPGRARIAPPRDASATPDRLPLGPGVQARDFKIVDPLTGEVRPVGTFAPVKPDAVIEVIQPNASGTRLNDLLVVSLGARPVEALVHYDHLVAGWWRLVPRYVRLGGPPSVVVLVRGDDRAVVRVVSEVDGLLTSRMARIGIPPEQWVAPGRAGIWFAVERGVHDGSFGAWRVSSTGYGSACSGPRPGDVSRGGPREPG